MATIVEINSDTKNIIASCDTVKIVQVKKIQIEIPKEPRQMSRLLLR